jgi:predicted MFS family arabinose efflux permease
MRERPLLLLLLAVQFVPTVDGVLLMPLGPVLMHELGIGTGAYGLLVGGAALAAACAGLAGAMILDRFSRRTALCVVLLAFAGATALCASADGYAALLAGRLLAGASGGLVGALVLAVVGDTVPPERRGAATGLVMSSFAVASVVGVPIGAYAGVHGHWQWPFAALAALAAAGALAVRLVLPRLDAHLDAPRLSPWGLLADPSLRRCYALSAAVGIAGFLVIPLISPYLVGNAGLPLDAVPAIYLVGGIAAVVTTPLIGRLADRLGPRPVFVATSLIATLPMLAVTHLPPLPAWVILAVTTVFIVFVSGRYTAHAALLGWAADPARRGAAFALGGAVNALCVGGAAVAAGFLTTRGPDGAIHGYGTLGVVAALLTAASLPLARGVRPAQAPPR